LEMTSQGNLQGNPSSRKIGKRTDYELRKKQAAKEVVFLCQAAGFVRVSYMDSKIAEREGTRRGRGRRGAVRKRAEPQEKPGRTVPGSGVDRVKTGAYSIFGSHRKKGGKSRGRGGGQTFSSRSGVRNTIAPTDPDAIAM